MQKFLGMLSEKKSHIYDEEYGDVNSSTAIFFDTMMKKFRKLEGKRVQYKDKNMRSNAVVKVKKAYPHYVLVERVYFSSGTPYTSCTAITYGALYCNDAVLREEQMCSE